MSTVQGTTLANDVRPPMTSNRIQREPSEPSPKMGKGLASQGQAEESLPTRDLRHPRPAEQALRESEERFRLMVESVGDYAIFMLDPDGRVATWNTGAERIKGYTAAEIIGEHFSRFYPEEARQSEFPKYELEVAAREGRFEDEGWRIRKDGSRFWANVIITALYDSGGQLRGFGKVTRDLTERRAGEESLRRAYEEVEQRVEDRTRELAEANAALLSEIERRERLERERAGLEEELRRHIAELAAADRHKNEFLAMLGHELRNPLAPIRNALEILKLAGIGEATHSQARATIGRQVQHLVRLVDDLLDISRIMEGKVELRSERIELAAVVGRAIEMAQPSIDAGGHQLEISLPEDPVELDGDLVRLSQVLGNLLINAAKYTPAAGRIELSATASEDRVALRVRDNGIGIAPELLPRVFDFFVQGGRSLARSQGGLGIGLTLVRRITQMHGGSVSAHSGGEGRGSEFLVELPLPPRLGPREKRGKAAPARAPAQRRRVLVVDDNIDAAESAAALLAIWGHEVRIVHDGSAALAATADFRPDAVLLDIGLPGKNGYQVARELRDLPGSNVRLLAAMTGYGQEEDRRRSAEAGFDVHLTKPLDLEQLQILLDELPG